MAKKSCNLCFVGFLIYFHDISAILFIFLVLSELLISMKPEKPFNSSLIPDYFVHLTDAHIDHKYEQSSVVFNTVLNHIEYINPMLSFFTCDLADDFTKSQHRNYAVQQPEDHGIYYNLTSHYDRSSKLFETAGNHDEYGVSNFNVQHLL